MAPPTTAATSTATTSSTTTGRATSAAFVRVEETLLPPRDLQAALYLAARAPGVLSRLSRLGALGAALPALGVAGRADRRLGRRAALLACAGLGRDRIEVLLREHAERDLAGLSLRERGLEVLARARRDGHRVVLVTSTLAPALAPLAARLGADALVGDDLEYRDGVATGKVVEARRGDWLRDLARREGLALEGCYAYGCDLEDEPMLRAVGFPCAVNPDARLRRVADREGWPVVRTT